MKVKKGIAIPNSHSYRHSMKKLMLKIKQENNTAETIIHSFIDISFLNIQDYLIRDTPLCECMSGSSIDSMSKKDVSTSVFLESITHSLRLFPESLKTMNNVLTVHYDSRNRLVKRCDLNFLPLFLLLCPADDDVLNSLPHQRDSWSKYTITQKHDRVSTLTAL